MGGGAHPRLAVENDRATIARHIADAVEGNVQRAGNALARVLVSAANVDQVGAGIDRSASASAYHNAWLSRR
ncbi:hypothetical protein GCM10019060_32340 [Novosphingobium pokkalii]|nr:hypothetical protein GCM10019060_32340 [Novosphingobium pokkalii]